MKTISAKPGSVERKWYVVDLDGRTVGRVATRIATILRGKHKPEFTPHVDTGDFVIAINADKVTFTGRKQDQKRYHHHSGYAGGIKETTVPRMLVEKPEEIIRAAVRRMLPKNRLGRKLFKKFKVYAGHEHPHQAQKPQPLELGR